MRNAAAMPLACLMACLMLAGCALPSLETRVASTALPVHADTRIGRAIAPLAQDKDGLTGVHALVDGRDAFAARMMMADAAERSLDIQYYIWRNDTTGLLLLDALRAAAGRGVRVRLLLDDNNSASLDPALALLDAHPNAEVRLFNPFAFRTARLLGFLTDFKRLNRRMHNKSFTADGQATIVGGRNVGNEYYDATGEVLFADLDVLAVGAVVGAVQRDFDRYWNSRSAYPAGLLLTRSQQGDAARLDARRARLAGNPGAQAYLRAMRSSTFVTQLTERTLPLEWVKVELVSDDPDKVLGASPEAGVAYQLPPKFGEPLRQVDLVSPYFVPGANWTARFGLLARNGIRVRILTNSLEATDVPAVHAGYARWRRSLLADGVRLLELKRSWPQPTEARRTLGGSSGSSLHAKTFAVDQSRMFVGSFNFDPRSADLNTEMGFIIDSPALSARMSEVLDKQIMARAYEVTLTPQGRLQWHEQGERGMMVHDIEPGTTLWQRATVQFMSLLPIEWML
ncbi:phospholipase D family protein [Massilia sp. PAMC28688]|uniref:phospholipase D family protein n=1 Tax=Massilia sp. PAMC28688 TaxID=2861283 RepID=UPI001C6330EF|nr:phospholipase D family protein [Massilia sp. PAMC28688]QYF92727.1 phospholipase D family protein [Massilia sp. PAMC28688]